MASYRVLVVEDNHEVRRMVSASIKALDSEIDVLDVPSAEEALLISASLPLDLVVLDIRLPGMSGLDMVTRLRKRRPETKVILVTGIDDKDIRQRVALSDVEAYFFKPIEINAFLDAVRKCLWPSQVVTPPVRETPKASAEPSIGEAKKASQEQAASAAPQVKIEASEPSEPQAVVRPGAGGAPRTSQGQAPSPKPGRTGAAPVKSKPQVAPSPGTSEGSAVSMAPTEKKGPPPEEPPGTKRPSTSGTAAVASAAPSATSKPVVSATKPVSSRGFQPTVDERLTALNLQLSATTVLLVDDTGKVLEVAGNPAPLTTGSVLLPALMQAIRASLQISQAFGRGTSESLQYFHTMKQSLYLSVVGEKQALLVVMSGYFDPDKLGIIDRAMHLAAQDILAIQEQPREEEVAVTGVAVPEPTELPAEIPVDEETRALIDEMFSSAIKESDEKEADGFWEALEESGALDAPAKKDSLSYDQAREMGLVPDENQPS